MTNPTSGWCGVLMSNLNWSRLKGYGIVGYLLKVGIIFFSVRNPSEKALLYEASHLCPGRLIPYGVVLYLYEVS